jgi:hypothetical protein
MTTIYIKPLSVLLLVCGSCCLLSSLTVRADDKISMDWFLDVDAGYQQQRIEKSTTELKSVTFAPSLGVGNWDLSLTVPWYEKQGEFYIDGIRPHLVTRCERLTNLIPARQKRLIETGKLTQKQLDGCDKILDALAQLNDMHSGVGDLTSFARYHSALGDSVDWSTNFGLGYKADTGDSETGIGSGTKEAGLSYQANTFSFGANAGYDIASGDNSIDDIYQTRNYLYATLSAANKFTNWLTLGISLNAQQAYVVDEKNTKILTEYMDISPLDQLRVHLSVSQYSGDSYLPDKEVGANITYSF